MKSDRSRPHPTRTSGGSGWGRAIAWLLIAAGAVHGVLRAAGTAPQPNQTGTEPSSAASTGGQTSAGAHRTRSSDQVNTVRSPDAVTAGTASRRPGERAEAPTNIPATGWWQVTRRAFKESTADNVSILAAGVAFFAFLAIPPALIAGLTLYGLVADPQTVTRQMGTLAGSLPREAQPLIADQLNAVASGSNGALSLGLAVAVLAALWSASSGTSNLMTAVNIAYDEQETRGFVKLRALALVLTLGAIVFLLLTLFLVAVVPPLLQALQLGIVGTILAQVARWALLIALVVTALAIVYRLAPDRNAPKFIWTSPGALVATALWALGSIGFSLYVNNFGSYNKTYGALAGVIVFLLWLYLTSYIILLGAEVNAESEKQTTADTTVGDPMPMGQRRAVAADTVAEPPNTGSTR
jgi:membrane protein